jgi:hypothetical protein
MLNLKILAVKIPDSWKVEIVSAGHTFVASFMVEFAVHINELSFSTLSMDVVKSIMFAAFRSGIKALALWVADSMKKPVDFPNNVPPTA